MQNGKDNYTERKDLWDSKPKYTNKALSPKALNTMAIPQNLYSKYTQRVPSPKSHKEKSKFL